MTRQLLTLDQFAEQHPAFPVSTLRWLRFRSTATRRRTGGVEERLDPNGYHDAFLRVGGRVLINPDKFWAIVAEQNGQGAA